jgi:hypothetical protein
MRHRMLIALGALFSAVFLTATVTVWLRAARPVIPDQCNISDHYTVIADPRSLTLLRVSSDDDFARDVLSLPYWVLAAGSCIMPLLWLATSGYTRFLRRGA